MAKMNIMNETGHDVIEWTRPEDKAKDDWTAEDQASVDKAMAAFGQLVADGNRFVDKDKGERADTFNPNVREYTMIPHVVGG